MPDTALGLMAKFPLEGKVKTRLAADIGSTKALTVYLKLLADAVALVRGLKKERFRRTALVAPAEKANAFKAMYPGFDHVMAQQGDDLGQRMLRAFEQLLKGNDIDRAVLIGCDIPDIDTALIEESRQLLDKADLVLGPTEDGGYYLIGLKKPYKALFKNIDWGTNSVLERTLVQARKVKLKVALLPRLHDLDTLDDLKRFEEYRQIIE